MQLNRLLRLPSPRQLTLTCKDKGRLTRLYISVAAFSFCIIGLLACSGKLIAQTRPYKTIPNGIILKIEASNGLKAAPQGKYLRLQFITPKILRVSVREDQAFPDSSTLMILPRDLQKVSFRTIPMPQQSISLQTASLQATVNLRTGHLSFKDAMGQPLLRESKDSARSMSPVSIGRPGFYSVAQTFDNVQGSHLYGLGGNQLGWTDLKGKDLEMVQYNSNVFVPFLVSTGHFGLLWNNSSVTRFGHPERFEPLGAGLQLFDAQGKAGSLTATYLSERHHPSEKLVRAEKSIPYAYAKDTALLPAGFSMNPDAQISWEGYLQSSVSGTRQFDLKFGGYIKIWIDGKLLTDWWRQCWNPAEKRLEVAMIADRKYKIKVQWQPDGTASFASLRQKPMDDKALDQIHLASEAASQIDYYLVTGGSMDSLISGYRYLTGKAPIMPKWAYGFWQSKEHYNSQQEILQTARQFREKHIPIDNIVQDWYYWKQNNWGAQEFDSSRYPDPKALTDSLHNSYNMHFMISVWPKFYVGTKPFQSFWDKGWLYKKNVENHQKDWMGYVSTFYDAFNPEAGKAFWNLVDKNIYSKGVDAWWLDATEPDIVDNITNDRRMGLMTPTYAGAPQINFNAYALAQDATFYHGQREQSPEKRVFILTRSSFAGAQRYAAATWSGDIGATWKEMKNQIATGISFCLAGVPYWSMDIGGFAVENRFQNPDAQNLAEWRELQSRWFQFGAFCPIFRSHGQAPAREMFNIAPASHPAYKSMLYYDQLRYRLMPYIYAMGAATYFDNYTMMRGLAMDFPADKLAVSCTDEYMFGPGLLVCPVYQYEKRTKDVYLPASKGWYDLYNGQFHKGAQTIQANAPYERMPVFVKAGTILPVGSVLEHTGQKASDTLTLMVYAGQDGQFTLYADQGTNNDYENGSYRKIQIAYNDAKRQLQISAPTGSYKTDQKQIFKICWIQPSAAAGMDKLAQKPQFVQYQNQALTVPLQ